MLDYRGKILISNSTIVGDYFDKSVVLIIDHNKEGAFGLILNKGSDQKINEIFPGIADNAIGNVFIGGPVDTSFISLLYYGKKYASFGIEIVPNLYIGRSAELLTDLIKNNIQYKVFQGYSGWGGGQLEMELEKKSWIVHDLDLNYIFSENQDCIWRGALKSKGGIYKYFAEKIKDPLLN